MYVYASGVAVPTLQKGNAYPEVGAEAPYPVQEKNEVQRRCCKHLYTDLTASGWSEMQKHLSG